MWTKLGSFNLLCGSVTTNLEPEISPLLLPNIFCTVCSEIPEIPFPMTPFHFTIKN